MGKAAIRGYRFSRHNAFPKGEGKEEAASPPKKEANPASRGHSLLPMEGGAPKGRRLDGGSGMKEREIVSSTPFAKAPYPPLTRSPFPQWEGCDTRMPLFSTQRLPQGGKAKSAAASPPKKEANPASLRSAAPSKGRGSRGHSLLPMEGGAPKGRRLDGGSGMKEREIVSSAPLYESTRAPRIYMGRCPKVSG